VRSREWEGLEEGDGETEGGNTWSNECRKRRLNANREQYDLIQSCILWAIFGPFYVCSNCLYPKRAVKTETLVLFYKVTNVSWPSKEATTGAESVENSCKKDLSVLAEWCSADLSSVLLNEGQGDACSNSIYNPEALPCQYASCICLKGSSALWFIDPICSFLGDAAWFCQKRMVIKIQPK